MDDHVGDRADCELTSRLDPDKVGLTPTATTLTPPIMRTKWSRAAGTLVPSPVRSRPRLLDGEGGPHAHAVVLGEVVDEDVVAGDMFLMVNVRVSPGWRLGSPFSPTLASSETLSAPLVTGGGLFESPMGSWLYGESQKPTKPGSDEFLTSSLHGRILDPLTPDLTTVG